MGALSDTSLADAFRRYAVDVIAPVADAWDAAEAIPRDVYTDLAAQGWLGGPLATKWGGHEWSAAVFGEFCAAIGGASMSLLSTLTVHHMAMSMIAQWGDESLQQRLLPAMVRGECLGGFALTEPGVGCAATDVATVAEKTASGYSLNGTKKWTSGGMLADGFVVLTRLGEEGPTAFWAERAAGGLTSTLISGMLGFRAAMNTEQQFAHVPVTDDAMLGPAGGGFAFVFNTGLDLGRFIIAWGSLGLMRASLTAAATYATTRRQFGKPLAEHQLIQRHLAEMHTSLRATEGLCRRAAELRDARAPNSIMETATAKYFASRAASRGADLAVQIHGAEGCGPGRPVQRYFRDARITELIEGSNEMQEIMLGQYAVAEYGRRPASPRRVKVTS